jgi:TonB family protein
MRTNLFRPGNLTNFLRARAPSPAWLPATIAALLILASNASAQSTTLERLKSKVEKQYEKIYDLFQDGSARPAFVSPRERVTLWQADLADAFAEAEVTIGQILRLDPPDKEHWLERRETMRLYSTPISPPETREVFGKSELEQAARLIDSPAAKYPVAAIQAKARGEVRLRLVLAADGSVKYIFPMKPLKHGLTEAAIEAAKQIKFEPGVRNGQPASQFFTLSYLFKDGKGLPPFVPEREFTF